MRIVSLTRCFYQRPHGLEEASYPTFYMIKQLTSGFEIRGTREINKLECSPEDVSTRPFDFCIHFMLIAVFHYENLENSMILPVHKKNLEHDPPLSWDSHGDLKGRELEDYL